MRRTFHIFIILSIISLVPIYEANAYIDPISGTILIQALIAAVVGSVAFFRKHIANFVKLVFKRSVDRETSAESSKTENNQNTPSTHV